MRDTAMYRQYQQVAPRPHDFGPAAGKIGASMSKDFHIDEDVRGRQVPTLIVYADADTAPPSHDVEVSEVAPRGHGDGGWMAKAGQGAERRCCPASDPLQPRHQPLFAPPSSSTPQPATTRELSRRDWPTCPSSRCPICHMTTACHRLTAPKAAHDAWVLGSAPRPLNCAAPPLWLMEAEGMGSRSSWRAIVTAISRSRQPSLR